MNIIRGILRGAAFILAVVLTIAIIDIGLSVKRSYDPVRIATDLGGSLFGYIETYSNARAAKTTYIIDGLCVSACTMITGEIPNDRVCVTPYAKLAFHAAFRTNLLEGGREFSPEGTEVLWRIYPEWVQKYLQSKGWPGPEKDQPTLIWMEAKELMLIYKPCPTN